MEGWELFFKIASIVSPIIFFCIIYFPINTIKELLFKKIDDLNEKIQDQGKDLNEKIQDQGKDLKEKIQDQGKDLKEVRDSLIARGILTPFTRQESPKQITEHGHSVLRKHSVDEWMLECPLVKSFEKLREKEELDIYLDALKYLNNEGRRKVDEILYNEKIDELNCLELLACAIRDKILKTLDKSSLKT